MLRSKVQVVSGAAGLPQVVADPSIVTRMLAVSPKLNRFMFSLTLPASHRAPIRSGSRGVAPAKIGRDVSRMPGPEQRRSAPHYNAARGQWVTGGIARGNVTSAGAAALE